jgi:hypothetical protein
MPFRWPCDAFVECCKMMIDIAVGISDLQTNFRRERLCAIPT